MNHVQAQARAQSSKIIDVESFILGYKYQMLERNEQLQQLQSMAQQRRSSRVLLRYKNLLAEKKHLAQNMVQELKQELNQGALLLFPQFSYDISADFMLKAFDYKELKKMVRQGSNILNVVFDAGNYGSDDFFHRDWTQKEDTLLSKVMKIPTAQKSAATYDFIAFALRKGADLDFKTCDLSLVRTAEPSRGEDGGLHYWIHTTQKGIEETILHIAAKNLDLRSMEMLLSAGASPNQGLIRVDTANRKFPKLVQSGVLKSLFHSIANRPMSSSFYMDVTHVVKQLKQRGIDLDKNSGNANVNMKSIQSPTAKKLIEDTLYPKPQTKSNTDTRPWYAKLLKKTPQPNATMDRG